MAATPIRRTLKSRRLAIGATQKQIASLAGLCQGNLSEIENGKRAKYLEQVDALLSALGLVVVPAESVAA